jgi:two-component system nitrogen regulation response regulator NtrX
MGRPLVAVLDDDAGFRAAAAILLSEDFETVSFAAGEPFFQFLEEREPDVLLLDVNLGEGVPDGFAVLDALRAKGLGFPVIMLTILAGLEVTSRALRMGVPFLQKDRELDADRFRQQISLVLRASQLSAEIDYHRRLISPGAAEEAFPWPMEGWGAELRREIEPFLRSAQPLLLEGERGTGKQTLARWVHRHSSRADGPFLVVSPLGVDEAALYPELFGSSEAARPFTPGALDAAAGGTLFLEDLHLLPDAIHHRLVRAIEEGAFASAGSGRRRRLTCRLIASRSVGDHGGDLGGTDDLFWKAYRIRLSPLRERPEDIRFHIDRIVRELSAAGVPVHPVPVESLAGRNLPGNFYDLKGALLRGASFLDGAGGGSDVLESGVWKKLAEWPLRKAYAEMLVRYLREVEKIHGRDVDRWKLHIGYERAQVYRFFKILDDEV